MSRLITIVRTGVPLPPAAPGELVVSFDDFRSWIRSGRVWAHIARHGEGRLLVYNVETAGRPLPLGLALGLMARRGVSIEDVHGRRRALTGGLLARWTLQLAAEPFAIPALLARVGREVDEIERGEAVRRPLSLEIDASPFYLRTDLSFGVRAGGSVAHISGVVNELDALTGPVVVFTTDDIPTVKPDVETHLVAPSERFWNFKELPTFLLNGRFDAEVATVEAGGAGGHGQRKPAFVYQRYSLNNYAGIRIARRHGVPFVLEYNGSEIWVARHWGRPLKYERLSRRIELLNLRSADLIVVVSRALLHEAAGRGVDPASVLVNPNGVDPDRYRPEIDGAAVRERHGLGDAVVVGFIGTFGPWHGAEVLARAFVTLLSRDPALAQSVRLLMIGDGALMPQVRKILAEGGVMGSAVLTGLIPQADGPRYLAACDVLASPHVPNPDGTPFFGSPTKLFEYMAMGRGIVASDLEQVGEVLDHGRTAWLVKAGDVDALAGALKKLIDDRHLREALGAAARQEVLAQYTWRAHVRRTVDRLQEVVASSARAARQLPA